MIPWDRNRESGGGSLFREPTTSQCGHFRVSTAWDKMAEMPEKLVLRYTALQSRDAVELLADKWRIAVIHLLRNGALRTHQLQEALEYVSPKMLTETLRGLERDGFVTRNVYPVAPSRVEYELTKMGRSVIKPLHELCQWAKAHVPERDAARAKFDLGRKRDNGNGRARRHERV